MRWNQKVYNLIIPELHSFSHGRFSPVLVTCELISHSLLTRSCITVFFLFIGWNVKVDDNSMPFWTICEVKISLNPILLKIVVFTMLGSSLMRKERPVLFRLFKFFCAKWFVLTHWRAAWSMLLLFLLHREDVDCIWHVYFLLVPNVGYWIYLYMYRLSSNCVSLPDMHNVMFPRCISVQNLVFSLLIVLWITSTCSKVQWNTVCMALLRRGLIFCKYPFIPVGLAYGSNCTFLAFTHLSV